MRPCSYLIPPRLREIARFMNLSVVIKWGKRMLKRYHYLTPQEKQTFEFVKQYRSLINELDRIFNCTESILKRIRNKGLSKKNIDWCLKQLRWRLAKAGRIGKVRKLLVNYLEEEKSKIEKNVTWHASSEILESLFGTYKYRRSKNPLNGVTSYVLLLPLLTRSGEIGNPSSVNYKESLECVFIKDLKHWSDVNLTENLAIKRFIKLAG